MNEETPTPNHVPAKQPEQITVRRAKLQQMREQGEAYGNHWRNSINLAALLTQYEPLSNEALAQAEVSVQVSGRMVSHRVMGRSSFITIQSEDSRLQLFLNRKVLVDEALYDATKKWDLGDIVGAKGVVFRTRTGELSLRVLHIEIIVKCLRPLPEKWHGLADKELRYRQRYVDLIVSDDSRKTFRTRSKILSLFRSSLESQGFIEVETPMLHAQATGAAARPFTTHHHALNIPLVLRIAPELHLKRLLVGGFERVFEINRNFRNEGVDATHNPEFTMVEFYEAYADFQMAMDNTECILRNIAEGIDKTHVQWEGVDLDFTQAFKRLRLDEAVFEKRPDLRGHADDKATLATVCLQVAPDIKPLITWRAGHYLLALFEALVEKELAQPTFITHYPVDVSPLARRNDKEPNVTDRFELFVAGCEIANGFSELNDPDDQRARFLEQVKAKAAGDDEATDIDDDYIRALEYGMPCAAGVGIGVDRVVMMFTAQHAIRDVLLFPHMRAE
ncbi:MAG: lysine--tRNA ligase [Mariprofundaceae bacterium]|nr:lysine--tRNA ligase [Mariprofundaceae bacterium]